ncbi:MAG: DUF4846 domain-containing protein [Flavobacteriales bacterium]|nr:DUF4846 domain-containing protein [Flavobacteriales bacterium]
MGQQGSTLEAGFTPPPGSVRMPAPASSFAHYLRNLRLLPAGAPVLLHDGSRKPRQDAHAAVIDLSVGRRDLQQCADAVIRLRAEHLFATGRQSEIAFDFTNGFRAEWDRWRAGDRIVVNSNRCSWERMAKVDSSHAELLRFLDRVFTYAGTLSLSRELKAAGDAPIAAGDVFIQGGSPGHAMIVVDQVRAPDGRNLFLLAQSFMPAQQIHIVRNPDGRFGDWYTAEGDRLVTPEWNFAWSDRKRWP